jgi:hypothetical protein
VKNPILTRIKEICSVLNNNSVEYLIVGGTAMAFYNAYRATTLPSGEPTDKHDFDFWYNPTYRNYYNLLRALEELGQDVKIYWKEQEPVPRKSYFRYELDHFTLDFLPEVLGLNDFDVANKKRQIRKIGEVQLYVLGDKDLYAAKKAVGRQKDKDDIEFMESRGV